VQSQADRNRLLPDAIGLRRVAGWVSRSYRAMLADLEPVDSSSLDVLLYCTDDLVPRDETSSRAIVRVGDADGASRSPEHMLERAHDPWVELRSR
jgi:hypothetical protein